MAQATLTTNMEPYRKGTSFTEWVERLGSVFRLNKIRDEDKKDYFATLCGPAVYSEVKLLFPNDSYDNIAYDEMIKKLKSRFDKSESDIIHRFKFNHRVQQPDETIEDFVLSVKLQAEFCSFENFKEKAILDRIIAGVKDKALQTKLLSEENLSLQNAEKLVVTWEMAASNARKMGTNDSYGHISSLRQRGPAGSAFKKLEETFRLASESSINTNQRGPVKSRLGYQNHQGQRPYIRQKQIGWNKGSSKQKEFVEDRFCEFCGSKGHLKRKCFKLKNLKRDSVQFIEDWNTENGVKKDGDTSISGLFNRLRADKSDSEDDDMDTGGNWKRANNSASHSNTTVY
ncbi:uncharacterized protein LOC115257023 isoform X2 [Aedes albopictus]|uniref:CCHC-type domain-containing protein n=1 Tax=Aedes albopictus TaxID=7160 RepID=A0ABM1XJZ2_AEDAL